MKKQWLIVPSVIMVGLVIATIMAQNNIVVNPFMNPDITELHLSSIQCEQMENKDLVDDCYKALADIPKYMMWSIPIIGLIAYPISYRYHKQQKVKSVE